MNELPTIQQTGGHNLLYIDAGMLLKRPDTWLPQSRTSGQELYLRSLDHLGESSEAKDRENPKKVMCDGRTDRPMDQRTDRQSGV